MMTSESPFGKAGVGWDNKRDGIIARVQRELKKVYGLMMKQISSESLEESPFEPVGKL